MSFVYLQQFIHTYKRHLLKINRTEVKIMNKNKARQFMPNSSYLLNITTRNSPMLLLEISSWILTIHLSLDSWTFTSSPCLCKVTRFSSTAQHSTNLMTICAHEIRERCKLESLESIRQWCTAFSNLLSKLSVWPTPILVAASILSFACLLLCSLLR